MLSDKTYNLITIAATILLLILAIFSSLGYSISSDMLYAAAIVLLSIMTAVYCIALNSRASIAKTDYLTALFTIIILVKAENPIILISSLFILFFALKRLLKNKTVLGILIAVVVLSSGLRILGLKPTIAQGKFQFSQQTKGVYCDTSPNGDMVLHKTIAQYGNYYTASYYITQKRGLLEQTYRLTNTDKQSDESFFETNSTVVIGGVSYSTRR